jgi:hypothetical protein
MEKITRSYTDMTIKRLFALSGNQCSFPGCTVQMVNPDNAANSCICHIEALNSDGPRYNPTLTPTERNSYNNLILLCHRHHDEIDRNPEEYTVAFLKEMKQAHEGEQMNIRLIERPSMLSNAINAIASLDFSNSRWDSSNAPYAPEDKIKYNELKTSVPIIHEYKAYHGKINQLYDELDANGSIKKSRLLQNIREIYLKVKGQYVQGRIEQELEIIRNNADTIYEDVFSEICSRSENTQYWQEDLLFAAQLIMVDAFIRCKILEEPK